MVDRAEIVDPEPIVVTDHRKTDFSEQAAGTGMMRWC
jgi:hypothetical protein